MKIRTFGWVQNPSDFHNLKKVVQIFDTTSPHYIELRDELIQSRMYFDEDKKYFFHMLNTNNDTFQYIDLVGSSRNKDNKSPKKRAEAIANGLIQISILPQQYKKTGKRWTDNWTSDGYLRWAVSLNLVEHDREKDTFKITDKGLQLSRTVDGSSGEIYTLVDVIMAYPPAYRILNILYENQGKSLSKYVLGSQLGFQGERGFTSYNEALIFDWLNIAEGKERKSIKSDVEGTSDKYARGIANWLSKLGLVSKGIVYDEDKIESMNGYTITGKGIHEFKKASGSSKNTKKDKFLMWEFLATNAENKNYIRTRRAYILKSLEKTRSFKVLMTSLKDLGFSESKEVIINDIKGLNMFGIDITLKDNIIVLKDNIIEFSIPNLNVTDELKGSFINELKEKVMKKTQLPLKFYELIDIAYDGKRNRDFEIITLELFKEIYGLKTKLLGGGRKPDGLVYTNHFGIIVDTKAYKNGYSKNISQSDEMTRYIEDNKQRDSRRNKTEWWSFFPKSISNESFYFMWVSSYFIGQFDQQLLDTSYDTGYKGCALNVEQLLLGADAVQTGNLDITTIPNYMKNKEIIFVS